MSTKQNSQEINIPATGIDTEVLNENTIDEITKTNNKKKEKMKCTGCQQSFESKNALFRHLRNSAKTCLTEAQHRDFMKYVVNDDKNLEKIAVLYGYIPSEIYVKNCLGKDVVGTSIDTSASTPAGSEQEKGICGVEGGDHGAQLVMEAVKCVSMGFINGDHEEEIIMDNNKKLSTSSSTGVTKTNRSNGWTGRGNEIVAQDEHTGALTEVLCMRAPPLLVQVDDDNNDGPEQGEENKLEIITEQWLKDVNQVLDRKISSLSKSTHSPPGKIQVFGRQTVHKKFHAEMDVSHRRVDYLMPAEFLFGNSDICNQEQNEISFSSSAIQPSTNLSYPTSLQSFFDSLPCFSPGSNPHRTKSDWESSSPFVKNSTNATTSSPDPCSKPFVASTNSSSRPKRETLEYLYKLKKIMQRLTTQIVEVDLKDQESVLVKKFHDKKRKKQRFKQNQDKQELSQINGRSGVTSDGIGKDTRKGKPTTDTGKSRSNNDVEVKKIAGKNNNGMEDEQIEKNKELADIDVSTVVGTVEKAMTGIKDSVSTVNKINSKNQKKRVLKRRRFHNFTAKVMAHEFLAFRRMDRFYHRATVRIENFPMETQGSHAQNANLSNIQLQKRPFLVLSITGDLFLTGQVRAVIGLFLAIVRGFIHEDIIDCIFDEEYTNLVPAPMVPRAGMYAAEATYSSWEGKMKTILSARTCNRYEKGWGDEKTIRLVNKFQLEMFNNCAQTWYTMGLDVQSERLISESRWVNEYLKPWSVRAREQLNDYRLWKAAQNRSSASDMNLTLAETLLPKIEMVDSTVPKMFEKVLFYLRQANSSGLWPATTPKRQLVMVSMNGDGKSNETLSVAHMKAQANTSNRESAYSFREGEGGASGSFSVGAMPGNRCEQPKGNALFPELMKAAFELEIALSPNREPSSTIAINRNAQFRPHVDSGAGAGQSTSLIAGLGTYIGGELMVEGEKKDIRYKGIEFNGWKQRHWTLPFRGERYSLVWFTPKGCEGVRGIDLCKNL